MISHSAKEKREIKFLIALVAWQHLPHPISVRQRVFSKGEALDPRREQESPRAGRLHSHRALWQGARDWGSKNFEIKDWLKQIFCQISVSEVPHDRAPSFSQIKMWLEPRDSDHKAAASRVLPPLPWVQDAHNKWNYVLYAPMAAQTLLRKQAAFISREIRVKMVSFSITLKGNRTQSNCSGTAMQGMVIL